MPTLADFDPATVSNWNNFNDFRDLCQPPLKTAPEQAAAIAWHAFRTFPALFQSNLARAFISGANVAQNSSSIGCMSNTYRQGENKSRQDSFRKQADFLVHQPSDHFAELTYCPETMLEAEEPRIPNLGIDLVHYENCNHYGTIRKSG